MSILEVCSDGSCLKNTGGPIGWGWADSEGRWMRNGAPFGTNQTAELLGLLSVLVAFPGRNLHIQLDSQYTLNIASKWAKMWAKSGWRRKDGEVKNLAYVQLIHSLMLAREAAGLITTFQWVKGHRKDNIYPLNTIADEKAGLGSRSSAKTLSVLGNYEDSAGNLTSKKQAQLLEAVGLAD